MNAEMEDSNSYYNKMKYQNKNQNPINAAKDTWQNNQNNYCKNYSQKYEQTYQNEDENYNNYGGYQRNNWKNK